MRLWKTWCLWGNIGRRWFLCVSGLSAEQKPKVARGCCPWKSSFGPFVTCSPDGSYGVLMPCSTAAPTRGHSLDCTAQPSERNCQADGGHCHKTWWVIWTPPPTIKTHNYPGSHLNVSVTVIPSFETFYGSNSQNRHKRIQHKLKQTLI